MSRDKEREYYLGGMHRHAPRPAGGAKLGVRQNCLPHDVLLAGRIGLQQFNRLLGPIDEVEQLGDRVQCHALDRRDAGVQQNLNLQKRVRRYYLATKA